MSHNLLPEIDYEPNTNNEIDRSNLVVLEGSDTEEDEIDDGETPRAVRPMSEEEQNELRLLSVMRGGMTHYHVDTVVPPMDTRYKFEIRDGFPFDITCWPPKLFGTTVTLEACRFDTSYYDPFFAPEEAKRVYERDLMLNVVQSLQTYINNNEKVVVVLNTVEQCGSLLQLMKDYTNYMLYFDSSRGICKVALQLALCDFVFVPNLRVFICTWDMERHGARIPYAKWTLVTKLDTNSVFMKSFASRQSETSRLRGEQSFIRVKLGVFEDPNAVRPLAKLLYERRDYPDANQLDFLSKHYMSQSEIQELQKMKEQHINDDPHKNLALHYFIGPYKDNWWLDREQLARMEQHIKPETEFPEHRQHPYVQLYKCDTSDFQSYNQIIYTPDNGKC